MRLTDRFTHTERRGLLIMLLIMAVIVAALIIRSYGMQRQVVVVRDTVTCFVEQQPDSTIPSFRKRHDHIKKTRRSTKPDRTAPTRNPLDEPVPLTEQK